MTVAGLPTEPPQARAWVGTVGDRLEHFPIIDPIPLCSGEFVIRLRFVWMSGLLAEGGE